MQWNKNKINDEKVRDSIGVDLSVKPTQVERKHKINTF